MEGEWQNGTMNPLGNPSRLAPLRRALLVTLGEKIEFTRVRSMPRVSHTGHRTQKLGPWLVCAPSPTEAIL